LSFGEAILPDGTWFATHSWREEIYMKSVKKYYSLIIILAVCAVAVVMPVAISAQTTPTQIVLSRAEKKIVSDFEKRAKNYSKLRERIEGRLPNLPDEATAEQIEAHKVNFQKSVQSARRSAKQGEIFIPAAAQLIRSIIKTEFKGKDRIELREAVLEAETKGVPLKVNYPYPETKEQFEMPATLLLSLPQLPKQLRYRFVGRSLLLVDRENGVIVDYMTNALP
jgi:hypothetical protein